MRVSTASFIGSATCNNVTLRGNLIFERQILDSTYAQGLSANPVDYLRNLKFSAEYVYDHTYALNVAWFQLTGTPDAFVYSTYQNLVPNTQGFIIDAVITQPHFDGSGFRCCAHWRGLLQAIVARMTSKGFAPSSLAVSMVVRTSASA